MKNNYFKFILIAIAIIFIIPSSVSAVWWNPFSWSIWGIFKTSQSDKGSVVPSDWKTYSNGNLGYEIKYPPELIIEKDESTGSGFYILTPGEGPFKSGMVGLKFNIGVRAKGEITYQSSLNLLNPPVSDSNYDISSKQSDFMVDGIKGQKIVVDQTEKKNGAAMIIMHGEIKKGNYIYSFDCQYNYKWAGAAKQYLRPTELNSKYDCSTFDKMMSTFKFTK